MIALLIWLACMCLQPGVASVYCTIVQQSLNGSEFYIRAFSELDGLTFGAARRCFNGVIVVGYMRKGGDPELRLNPDDRDILKEGDRIVALADTGEPPTAAICLKSTANLKVAMPPKFGPLLAWVSHSCRLVPVITQ